jgi:Autophagy protein ATG9
MVFTVLSVTCAVELIFVLCLILCSVFVICANNRPLVLCFSLPSCSQDIIDFVAEHSVDVDGIGSVCSYSLFDFQRYPNSTALLHSII